MRVAAGSNHIFEIASSVTAGSISATVIVETAESPLQARGMEYEPPPMK